MGREERGRLGLWRKGGKDEEMGEDEEGEEEGVGRGGGLREK